MTLLDRSRLRQETLDRALPFAIHLDAKLRVRGLGRLMPRVAPSLVVGGQPGPSLRIARPSTLQWDFPSITEHHGRTTILITETGMRLVGEFLSRGAEAIWLGTLGESSLSAISSAGITLEALPPTDSLVDWLIVSSVAESQRRQLADHAEQLERESAKLRLTSERLQKALAAEAAAREDLSALDATRNEFYAFMSHETRTPVQAVLGMASLLSEAPLAPEHQRLVRILKRSVVHLNQMLDLVSDMTKLSAGTLDIRDETFCVEELLEECNELLSATLPETGVTHSVSMERPIPPLLVGDAARIREILFNLTSNAAKYTDHGTVEVRASFAVTDLDHGTLSFSVADTGFGIPLEDQALIFNKGRRLAATANRPGIGFGLYTSRAIAHALGGTLSVQSAPGKGSTFALSVPVRTNAAPAELMGSSADTAASWPFTRRTPHLLLVEDFPATREFVSVALRAAGYRVDMAATGKAALASCRATRYDLVIVDLTLPDLDGGQVAAQIHADQRQREEPPTPIVALTALTPQASGAQTDPRDIDATYFKPLDAGALRHLARNHVPRVARVLIADQATEVYQDLRRRWERDEPIAITRVAARADLNIQLARQQWDAIIIGTVAGLHTPRDINAVVAASGPAVVWVLAPALASANAALLDPRATARAVLGLPEARPTPTGRSDAPGDAPDISDLIQAYIADLPDMLRRCRAALDAGNLDQVRRIAHDIKGSARTFGAPSLEAPARALESLAAGGLPGVGEALEALAVAIGALIEDGTGAGAPSREHA